MGSALAKLGKVAVSIILIAAITFVYSRIIPVNSTTVALTFVLATLGIATHYGLLESIVASVVAMLCFNFFFLPPVGTFTIEDPQNWIALIAFVLTAVVASQLSASEKKRSAEATGRRLEMERLYSLSRALMLVDDSAPVPAQVAAHIVQTFGIAGSAFFDRDADRVFRAGEREIPNVENRLRDAAAQEIVSRDTATGEAIFPVTLGGQSIGSIAVIESALSDTVLYAIANLAAVAVERARAQEFAARAEATRQNERIKSTMLDAMAHEFKTPLTSIKAATSAMLDDSSLDSGRRELIQIVDEETDRLNALVSESIQMARIEAGELRLHKRPNPVEKLVAASLAKMADALEGRRVEVTIPADLPRADADAEFVVLVFRQLLDNALKYSPPGSPLRIRAFEEVANVVIGVADSGPGIAASEHQRIFEKFYRGSSIRERIPGTGMGLTIAREIVRAHGGDLRVESAPGNGAEFLFSLPRARREVTA